ncbi:hypothetical protein [Andreprevotia chitinilytica]|uniref:hypothetical protein n=1 Tax=Andreprevotia chitinilytica TaxID=396808 RepID=UPI0012EC88CA|nr:hypothetical protein [Andreprevotia chitinilytica]
MRNLNYKALCISSLFLSVSVVACANDLLGTFGHDATENAQTPVWMVTQNGRSFNLYRHGDHSNQAVKLLSEADRKGFWEKMWWKSTSYTQAQCIGAGELVLCYVPSKARKMERSLKTQKNDYFYYDPMSGVMEVHKIK